MVQTLEEKRAKQREIALRWFHNNRELVLERKRQRYPQRREKASAEARAYYVKHERSKGLQRRFGITVEDYDAMLAAQGHQCASGCGRPKTGKLSWPVDHCHATGRIRAILCHKCNLALGNAADDPAILRKLADYLDHHNTIKS